MTDRAAIIKKALEFPMEKVMFRYQQDTGVSLKEAMEHEREVKRFLALIAIYGKAYGMKGPIDKLWHTFILFTALYHRFCHEVAGHYIHHLPNISGFESNECTNGSVTTEGAESYQEMLRDYEIVFSEAPPRHLWPRPTIREGGNYAAAKYWAECTGGAIECTFGGGDGGGDGECTGGGGAQLDCGNIAPVGLTIQRERR